MQTPPIPADEPARQAALDALKLLDTPPEQRFDRLTRIAQRHFNVPIALVSLVDRDRQWFKSKQGLEAAETGRDISFCGHAILSDDIFCVPDALEDPHFADNPLVTGGPRIRFYAGAPLHAPDGSRVGTLCIIDDKPRHLSEDDFATLRDLAGIVETEMVRTHLLASASEARIRAIVDTVIDGIISIDAQGLVQTANLAAERIFGYGREEMLGRNVNMLMPEPYHSDHDGYLHSYLTTGRKKIIGIGREVTGRRKDGGTFPMDLAVSEMEVGGQRMFTGIVRDLTERKRLERIKSEFVSTVSHELRTPLTSIRGAIGLVAGKYADALPKKAQEMLELAERNGERLTVLINDLLDLEKIESGRLELDFKPVDLVALARRACEDNEGYARRHDVRLRLAIEPVEACVHGDEHRLLQAFANLISNAVKYSPPAGEVEIAMTRRKEGFRVAVRDHGSGIPEEFRGRIFQRFAQADSSDTREKGGTGLGLSITKVIVEKHGGHIDYRSEPGTGTEFFFDLPAAQPSHQ